MTSSIETPALLFSTTSLIILAYTDFDFNNCTNYFNKCLRKNHEDKSGNKSILLEIKNLFSFSFNIDSLHANCFMNVKQQYNLRGLLVYVNQEGFRNLLFCKNLVC